MLKRKKLRFGNIGRFVQPQEIDFASKGRLVQIGGENKNSGGSSGAGKSTLLEVTDINLGISKTPTTIFQSRYTKEAAWTEGDYEASGVSFTIRRVTGKGLSVKWSGPDGDGEISGNNAQAEEKIQALIGMETDLFRRMTHKAQKEDGFFLSLTPGQSFGFMMKVLGLDDMLKKLEKVDLLISESEKKVAALQQELNTLGSKVNDQTEIVNKLKAEPLPEAPDLSKLEVAREIVAMRQDDLNKLKAEEDEILKSLRAQEDSLKTEIATLAEAALIESRKKGPIPPARLEVPPRLAEIKFEIARAEQEGKDLESMRNDKAKQIQTAIDGLRQQKNQADYAGKKMHEYALHIQKKRDELKHLEDRNCPTCKQKWIGLDMEAHIKGLQDEVTSYQQKIVDADAQVTLALGVQEKIERAQTILSALQASQPGAEAYAKVKALQEEAGKIESAQTAQAMASLTKYNEECEVHRKELDAIKSLYSNKLEEGRKSITAKRDLETQRLSTGKAARELELSSAKLEVSRLEMAKAQYDAQKSALDRNLATNQQYLDKYASELAAKNSEYQVAQQKFLIDTETKRLLKSFTNKKFEEALETIGRDATARLNKIPNMATASIYFEPFKEVKGKIKEEITVVLSMDGDVGIPLKSLSGGERSAADLAVDLAVADFIEEHSGMGADYLVLDEPCAGMDTVCKQEYIEMLKTMSTNKQIFIVEHSSEIKEMVDDTILVVRDGLYSEIQ